MVNNYECKVLGEAREHGAFCSRVVNPAFLQI